MLIKETHKKNIFIKEILIFVYLIKNYPIYLDRIRGIVYVRDPGANLLHILGLSINVNLIKLLVYLVFFLFFTITLILTANIRNNLVRCLLGVVFFIAAVFGDAYQHVTNNFLTYEAFNQLLDAAGFAGEAASQFSSIVIPSFLWGSVLLTSILLKPETRYPWPEFVNMLSPILATLLLSCVLYLKGGFGAQGLPIMFPSLAYSNLYVYEALHDPVGEKQPVSIARKNEVIDHDIIFIIDESTAASYLDFVSPSGVNTHLNEPHPGISLFNYGYAASVANCSVATNVVLRFGGTRDNYKKIIATMPSIWEYAKKAGLKTVYIDSQRTQGQLQNRMTEDELKDIDQFVQFNGTPPRHRDIKAADLIAELINNDQHELIVVNKVGAHFPIHDKYPDEFLLYKPVLPRGNFLDITDTGERMNFKGKPEDWRQYRNAYRNTLMWNVGKFFSIIFEKADLNKAIIIYTSDHGQDLHERGNPGTFTHCSDSDTQNMEEGIVPLLVVQGKNLKTLDWNKDIAENKNKSSHYNIFPTLLKLLGYEGRQVTAIYGKPLDEKTEDDFTYNYSFYARLGQKPKWKKIDLNKVAMPPVSDYQERGLTSAEAK